MEYEEIKKKFIEGIALEEIEEQEMRKKFSIKFQNDQRR